MKPLSAADCREPHIRLSGQITEDTYETFRRQLAKAPAEGLVVVEVSTPGGNPEVARMIGEDIRFESQIAPKRYLVFLGKTFVYSAGATLMSYFLRENRYFTSDTWLMVHERQMHKDVQVHGALSGCLPVLEGVVEEIRASIAIQKEGFRSLAKGSSVTLEELEQRARSAWYLDAREAHRLGFIEAVL